MRRFALLTAVLAACTLFVLGCGDDDDPTTPRPSATKIAVLDDDSTHVAMVPILEAAGHDVTSLGQYPDYDGDDFSAYDLVIILDGYDYGYELPDSVQQGLLDFVEAGGVLVTTEWSTYSDDWDLLIPALPLAYDGDYCDDGAGACIDTLAVAASHAITAGLPASFPTPPDYTYSFCVENTTSTSSNVTVLLTGQTAGAALGIADHGQGHLVHWNMAGVYDGEDIWDANTTRILRNIASFAR
ncbi:MAG: hypothetical protein IH621_14625 [Krumholzibacteria bacterium]|nr:hypothetical protein [Candidatus Krumholzibacteria bacterium]